MGILRRLGALVTVTAVAVIGIGNIDASRAEAASCAPGEWVAEYFSKPTPGGTPTFSRCEAQIDNVWVLGGPGNGVPVDEFSGRWVGTFDFPSGTFEFTATADDGIRVWVDTVLVIDSWIDQVTTTYTVSLPLSAGSHLIGVEYYENRGEATARVGWNQPNAPSAPNAPPIACSGVPVPPVSDLQPIFDANPGGTTFCLAPGVYRLTRPALPKSGSTIIGAPGTVLSGARALTSFRREGPYWVVDGQTQQAPLAGLDCEPGYDACRFPEGVFVDDESLRQVSLLSALSSGEFFFDYAGNRIYLVDDPSGHRVEASVTSAALAGRAPDNENVTVRGIVFEKFATHAAEGWLAPVKAGYGWVIDSNVMRLNHLAGIAVNLGSRATNNIVVENGQYGIVGEVDGGLVEGNEIAYNNNGGFLPNGVAGGTKFIKSSDLVIRDNYVHHNNGAGLWCDGDCIRITYEGNYLEQNTNAGILHEISYSAVIRNNTFRYNASSIIGKSPWWGGELVLNTSSNVEIAGNTIETNVNGIVLMHYERGIGAYGPRQTTGTWVHDNSVTLTGGGRIAAGLVSNLMLPFSSGNRFERNSYRVPTATGRYWEWAGTLTSSAWRAAGQDVNGSFAP